MSGSLSLVGLVVFVVFVKAEIQAWDDPNFTDRVIILRESISTMSVLPPPPDTIPVPFNSTIHPPPNPTAHRGDSMYDNVPLTPEYLANDKNGNFELKY